MNEEKAVAERSRERYYSFFLMTYNTKEEEIQPLLDKAFKWAWIRHDKDNTPEHLHIICTFKQNKSEASVKRLILGEQNTFAEPLKDKYKAFQYLTHENEDETKAAYEESEIHTNDMSYFQKGLNKAVGNEEFITDLLNPEMTDFERGCKYGRDYMKNIKSYQHFVRLVRFERNIQDYIDRGLLIYNGCDYASTVTGERIFKSELEQKIFGCVSVDLVEVDKIKKKAETNKKNDK